MVCTTLVPVICRSVSRIHSPKQRITSLYNLKLVSPKRFYTVNRAAKLANVLYPFTDSTRGQFPFAETILFIVKLWGTNPKRLM